MKNYNMKLLFYLSHPTMTPIFKSFWISEFIIDFFLTVILGFSWKSILRYLILFSIMLSFVIWCHAMKKSLNFPAINLDLASVLPSSIFYLMWNQLLLRLAPFLPWAETFLEGCQICECCWLLLYLWLLLLCLPLMLLCLSNDLNVGLAIALY